MKTLSSVSLTEVSWRKTTGDGELHSPRAMMAGSRDALARTLPHSGALRAIAAARGWEALAARCVARRHFGYFRLDAADFKFWRIRDLDRRFGRVLSSQHAFCVEPVLECATVSTSALLPKPVCELANGLLAVGWRLHHQGFMVYHQLVQHTCWRCE